jgi:hypothetical protein
MRQCRKCGSVDRGFYSMIGEPFPSSPPPVPSWSAIAEREVFDYSVVLCTECANALKATAFSGDKWAKAIALGHESKKTGTDSETLMSLAMRTILDLHREIATWLGEPPTKPETKP